MSTQSKPAVLMVAFHFPPMRGSSGLQRSLGFARYLPGAGWQPVVLAPHPRAYPDTDTTQLSLLPEGLEVHRSFCLDAARHLAILGRYPDQAAIPDRWRFWLPFAVRQGLRVIREHRPEVIWSTYPITTSHLIGQRLALKSGLPWIADFRDPMVERNPRTGGMAPGDPRLREARLKVERAAVESAAALVFCTDGARQICLDRYPELDPGRCHVIPNGYEEQNFIMAEAHESESASANSPARFTLIHSGTIYPTPDRDPGPFLQAVAALKDKGTINADRFRVILRATGHDAVFEPLLNKLDIADIVSLEPPLPYVTALSEMLNADGLLLFQGYTSNPAIPAKLYEYLRAGRPILALTDAGGSTAALLNELKTAIQASIEDPIAIENALEQLLSDEGQDRYPYTSRSAIEKFSRESLTGQLAELLEATRQR